MPLPKPDSNFRRHLDNHDEKKLEQWLDDAKACGFSAIVNFARTLMIQAARNAVTEALSNGRSAQERRARQASEQTSCVSDP